MKACRSTSTFCANRLCLLSLRRPAAFAFAFKSHMTVKVSAASRGKHARAQTHEPCRGGAAHLLDDGHKHALQMWMPGENEGLRNPLWLACRNTCAQYVMRAC